MKKLLATLLILVACIHVNAQESRQIRISTDRTDLILEVAPDGRLYQSYLGDRLLNEQDLKKKAQITRFYWKLNNKTHLFDDNGKETAEVLNSYFWKKWK